MEKYRELINTLTSCIIACENCAASCLEEENVKEMKARIQLGIVPMSVASRGDF